MKKKLLLVMILLMGVITLSGCNKKKENENTNTNNTNTVEESKISLAVSDRMEKIYVYDDNMDLKWKYDVTGDQAKYNFIRVDGNYLYFADGQKLYKKDFKNDEVLDLGIKMSGYWYFHVSGNDVLYSNVDEYNYVNMNDKNIKKLGILGGNYETIINGKIYYTDKETEDLKSYDINTKEIEVISSKARIEEYNKDSILYVNSNDEFILYNTKDKSSKVLFTKEYGYMSGVNYPIHLYNNKVYALENNKLSIISENKDLYTYKLEEYESIKNFIMLTDNKVLLEVFKIDINAEQDEFEPVGDTKYILVNIKTNETKEITENLEAFGYEYEFQNIY